MNEQDDTARVKTLYAAFASGDIQTILNHLAPDAEWSTESPTTIPYARKYVGSSQVAKFFKAMATTREKHSLTSTDFIAQADQVASSGLYSATVKATAKRFDTVVAMRLPLQRRIVPSV